MIAFSRNSRVVPTSLPLLAATLLLAMDTASAGFIGFNNFSYTGGATVYDTLADAQAGTNARSGLHLIPTIDSHPHNNARDGSIFADTDTPFFRFLTAWFFTPPDEISRGIDGFGNPNNTNTGFIQLADDDGDSLDDLSMSWNTGLDQFMVSASGANTDPGDRARFWPAPQVGGPASESNGEFLQYSFNLTASFSSAATVGTDGTIFSTDNPMDVSGSFSGIFQNTNNTDTSLNGFYTIDLSFRPGSWAQDNDAAALFRGGEDFSSTVVTYFSSDVVAPAAVPLPGSAMLLVLGMAGLAIRQWRGHVFAPIV